MAEKDLFSRLRRLFSTNTIVRNIGGRKLKIVDTGQLQSSIQTNLVDRYSKLYSNMQQYGYSDQLYQQQLRLGLFRDYESMDTDSIIASALLTAFGSIIISALSPKLSGVINLSVNSSSPTADSSFLCSK